MKIFLYLITFTLLILSSCTKKEIAAKESFDSAWEKYFLLCNFDIAKPQRCSELARNLDNYTPQEVTEDTLQKLLKHCNGKQANACIVLSWYFLKKNKSKQAINFGKSYCPQSPTACFYVGEAYITLNQLAKALPFLEKACNGEEAAGCERIGHFYLGEKKFEGAIKYFKKACDLEESFGCYNLACTYSLKGMSDLSYQFLEDSLKLGFNQWKTIENDKDLNFLRSKKDISSLMKKYKASSN